MDYHLVCVHPFGKYVKGQMITDPDEVAALLEDREHHFVRIAAPPAPIELSFNIDGRILAEAVSTALADTAPATRSIPRQP